MSATNFIEKMTILQKSLIDFLDSDLESDESFTNLRSIFDSQKIREDKHNIMMILDLLINIFKNHHRGPFFISKIEQILNYFKDSIKQHFTHLEIFNIFKYNERILLYFIKENLITIYFYPEISCFQKALDSMRDNFCNSNAKLIGNIELPKNFEELRQKSENESKICELIRNDSIDDFIMYVNKKNVSLHYMIKFSFYETNSLLIKIKEKLTLIDYAAYFGSIQIFNFLRRNGVKLTSSTFLCSIHGNNDELIYLLEVIKNKQNKSIDLSNNFNFYPRRRYDPNYSDEESHFEDNRSFFDDENLGDDDDFYDDFNENDLNNDNDFNDDDDNKDDKDDKDDAILSSFDSIINEAIKCCHNEIAKYFISNNNCENINVFKIALKYHNFEFIDATKINQSSFNLLCKYNYIQLVSILSNTLDLSNSFYNDQTPLFVAVESRNIEIIKILLNNDKIDVNYLNDVFFNIVLITFKINLFVLITFKKKCLF